MALASCCGTPALWVPPAANKPTTRVFGQSTHSPFVGTPLMSQHDAALRRTREKGHPGRARAGLPVISSVPVLGPLVNTLLSPLVLLAVYAFGAFKFFSGFSNTTYADALPTKVGLTIAWPVLFMVSQKYRSNFKKAVR